MLTLSNSLLTMRTPIYMLSTFYFGIKTKLERSYRSHRQELLLSFTLLTIYAGHKNRVNPPSKKG